MLKPFADTTLTDIVLEKLAQLGDDVFFAGYEDEFRKRCETHGVRFVKRDEESIYIDRPIVEILSFLGKVDFDHLLLVSSCAPFLRSDTIETFLKNCVAHGCAPAFSVAKHRKYFMDANRKPVNFNPTIPTLNTKTVQPLYECLDALYFFNRHEFLSTGRYWDWQEVRLIEMTDKRELFDIDTEEDFRMAESLWRALHE